MGSLALQDQGPQLALELVEAGPKPEVVVAGDPVAIRGERGLCQEHLQPPDLEHPFGRGEAVREERDLRLESLHRGICVGKVCRHRLCGRGIAECSPARRPDQAAGAGGGILAYRLAEAGCSVLSLEQGAAITDDYFTNHLSPERQSELTATLDACMKANVAIYALDARGLLAGSLRNTNRGLRNATAEKAREVASTARDKKITAPRLVLAAFPEPQRPGGGGGTGA